MYALEVIKAVLAASTGSLTPIPPIRAGSVNRRRYVSTKNCRPFCLFFVCRYCCMPYFLFVMVSFGV